MPDMYDAGVYVFLTWSKQEPAPNDKIYWNRWLGEFDPEMSGEEANRRLDHVGKLTLDAQNKFIRGWETGQVRLLSHKERLAELI